MKSIVLFVALFCFFAPSADGEIVFVFDDVAVVAVCPKELFTLSEWQKLKVEVADRYQKLYPELKIVVTRDSTVYFGLVSARERGDESSALFFAQKAEKAAT